MSEPDKTPEETGAMDAAPLATPTEKTKKTARKKGKPMIRMSRRPRYQPWMNPWILFWRDVRSVATNSIGLIIALGLIVVPALYTWFNVGGEMDLYSHTSSLQVAVADTDSGYESNLIPVRVDIGQTLTNKLRANKSFDWQFTTEQQAIDGVKSGKYYAAIVIPPDFSDDMMTLFSPTTKHASLEYYTNEKLNPIAPKLITEGADAVRTEVNAAFTSAITTIGLGLADGLGRYLDSTNASSAIANLDGNLRNAAQQAQSNATLVGSYRSILLSARNLSTTASGMLPASGSLAAAAKKATGSAAAAADSAGGTLATAADAIDDALTQSSAAFGSVSSKLDAVTSDLSNGSSTAADQIDTSTSAIADLAAKYSQLADSLNQLEKNLPNNGTNAAEDKALAALRAQLNGQTTALNAAAASLTALTQKLTAASARLRSDDASNQRQNAQIRQDVATARSKIAALKNSTGSMVSSQLRALASQMDKTGSEATAIAGDLDAAVSQIAATGDGASSQLGMAADTLSDAQEQLSAAAGKLNALASQIQQALQSKDAARLRSILSVSPTALASLVSSPVRIDEHAVYPVANFGSAIGPFYAILAMWIACLLDVVAIKPRYAAAKREGLRNLRPRQMYFGRQLSITFIAIIQCELIALGCLFYLRMQMVRPWMLLLLALVCAIVFSTITYSLVDSFNSAGEMVSELLLIVQITAAGGTYPVEVMPKFYQILTHFLPATHAINAMRYCVGGFYGTRYWEELGYLLCFLPPAWLLVLVLRKPFQSMTRNFTLKSKSAKLIV